MNDTTDIQPSRQALAARDRSLPGRVTGRLRRALDAMVWQAASRKEAAEAAKMTDHSLRQALKRPHVMRWYLNECEVLRISGRAKRLHRLDELASQDSNRNAAVAAIKAAELLGDETEGRSSAAPQSAGVIVVITQPAAPGGGLVDVTPPVIPDGD